MCTSRTFIPIIATMVLFAVGACDQNQPGTSNAEQANKNVIPVVYAVNFPLMSFARSTGGDLIELSTPALDGVHADDFKPTPEEIVSIQSVELILLNGAGFSPWTEMASLPSSRVVVTAAQFKDAWLVRRHPHGGDQGEDDHQHGPEGEGAHAHGDWASFTWLNPKHARVQAEAVGKAISRLLPEHARDIGERTSKLAGQLRELEDRAERLKRSKTPTLIASEPHYQYLAEACGLDLHEADWHWEDPAPYNGIEHLEQLVEATASRYILVPAQPTAERTQLLSRLGLVPVIVAPLAQEPGGLRTESFVELMGRNLDALESISWDQPSG